MSKMITVESGFQYSVNIAYDLNSDIKLRSFIPTKSSLQLLEEILLSTLPTSTERARVLVGAYGKGKSHMVLTILSMLMKRDRDLFSQCMPIIKKNKRLNQCVNNYYEGSNKLLPVIISGSSTSLPQAFLLALQRTLSDYSLIDIMPETNFKAASKVINMWKNDYPDVYKKFRAKIGIPVAKYTESLENYDVDAYRQFEEIYPSLTAGSVFNPFLGFDVIELYEEAVKGLKKKGYSGIYVIYDEFSKFLEANITQASVSDTKMLQDFAEKCNRSGDNQLHLMLISHKEISNYIDVLPKQKTDGWRGVSERFRHIHLNNNFSQTYEIVSSVIKKDEKQWKKYKDKNKKIFAELSRRYLGHAAFSDIEEHDRESLIYDCFPLHPISTFILPRLSERVAQNERTLFTFLSSPGQSTLSSFLDGFDDNTFDVITPDMIYDYFEPLLRKEIYTGLIHEQYRLTEIILDQIGHDSLDSKIVKTLALIYMLEQYEKIKPTKDEIVGVFSFGYDVPSIERAIDRLIEEEYVIYLRRSNNYLSLKQTSGIDLKQKISDTMETIANDGVIKDTLNAVNMDFYMYPSRYNDARDMVRYFQFVFLDDQEVLDGIDWEKKSEDIQADGVIYAIIPHSENSLRRLKRIVRETTANSNRVIVVLPKKYNEIGTIVSEYQAVSTLRENASDDKVLFDEYEVVYEDLRDVVINYINGYTRPEEYKSTYYYNGEERRITRRANLTGLMSEICENVYSRTPAINNEAINRDEITSTANNSRSKIIASLLRNELEPNLGLVGTGQDVSIMRSTLVRTHILTNDGDHFSINLNPPDRNTSNMLRVIERFILSARKKSRVPFTSLYVDLKGPEKHIGMRSGLIPIYLSAVLHNYKNEIVIYDSYGQAPINADTIAQINAQPENYSLSYIDWNPEKEAFIRKMASCYSDYIVGAERSSNAYEYVVNAMQRWYMSLPKYSKECKSTVEGERIPRQYTGVVKCIRQSNNGHEMLFEQLPQIVGEKEPNDAVADNILDAKRFYDGLLNNLKDYLITITKETFYTEGKARVKKKMSLSSVIKDWCETLDSTIYDELFTDGTDKCLELFSSITNDEYSFIEKLAKLMTDLRVEDWDESTIALFRRSLNQHKATAESYKGSGVEKDRATAINSYQLSYTDEDGKTITKRFQKMDASDKSKLLHNQITAALDSMGRAISEPEKRQVLVSILQDMC